MFFNLALRLPFCLSSSLPFVKSFSGCAKIYTIKTTTELVDYETDTWQLTTDQQLVDTKVKKNTELVDCGSYRIHKYPLRGHRATEYDFSESYRIHMCPPGEPTGY